MSSMPDQEYWLPPLRPVLRQAWLGLRRHDTHRRPTVADDLSSDPQSSAAHAYRRSDSLELVRRRRASQPDQGAQGRRAATRAMWRCCPPSTAAGGPRMPSARARSQRAAYGASGAGADEPSALPVDGVGCGELRPAAPIGRRPTRVARSAEWPSAPGPAAAPEPGTSRTPRHADPRCARMGHRTAGGFDRLPSPGHALGRQPPTGSLGARSPGACTRQHETNRRPAHRRGPPARRTDRTRPPRLPRR